MASRWLSVLLISGYVLMEGASAAVHGHAVDTAAERAPDGSFRARDAEHFDDEGEHNVEFDHEVILGSVKEAEEFDRLSPEESMERLSGLVARMDLNQDKFIDRTELKKWILNSFESLSKEEAQERFQEADANKDGIVTWTEYLQETFGVDTEFEVPDEDTNDSGMMVSEEKAMWKVADQNGDSDLDPEEFIIFANPEEHIEMHAYLINQTLREKDKDGDRRITFQEYVGERGSHKDREWLVAERERFEHELDLDQNGLLDEPEIKKWVIPDNEEIAEEEVDHLFAAADDDHDDLLSYEEILAHHDVFVGSRQDDDIHDHFDDEL